MTDAYEPEHRYINPWIIAVAVMFGTFMEVLDTTVVNVSLPHIAGSLSATVDESTWALTSYLVANAIVLPITGWLANTFGRKRLLMASVSGFTIASFLCGLAPNLPMLVFFRIIQGATGGALQPISQAVLLEAFPPHERGKAMGFWGLGIVVAPILGPVLGGWLTDSYSWRWVFYINIPVGIVSLIMTKLYIFDPPYIRRSDKGIDYWGIGMLAVGIGALQIVLDKGQEVDWFSSHWIAGLMVTAIVLLAIFIVWELMVGNPVVDLRVFKQRTYATGVFLMTTLGFVLYGSLVLLPIMLQTLFGYPALQAGIAMAPRGIGSFIFMPIVGMMLGRFDARKILVIGVALSAWTLIWLGDINLNAGYWDIFWPQFVQGVGMAFVFVPLTTITMDPDSEGTDGERHQPLQRDAEHRRQRRHRHRHDAAGAPPAGAHQRDGRPRESVQRHLARAVPPDPGRVRGRWRRSDDRRAPDHPGAVRHRAPAGRHDVVRRGVLVVRRAVLRGAAARLPDAPSERQARQRRGALGERKTVGCRR